MKEYIDYPDQKCFELILKQYPECCYFFKELWRLYHKGRRKFSRETTRMTFGISPTLLRNNLMKLSRLSILSFEEDENNCFCIRIKDKDVEKNFQNPQMFMPKTVNSAVINTSSNQVKVT